MNKHGILYGIGVGPGDPDLLTLRAVKALASVDVILAASSSKNDYSIAYNIAKQHLPAKTEIVRLAFPMTKDKAELQKAWEDNASITAKVLLTGQNVAFLTLGDPLIFSTFAYLLKEVLALLPDLQVCIEPGITSFQEAAAISRTVLCSANENFMLLSGVSSQKQLEKALELADNAAILKAYKNLPSIKMAVSQSQHSQANHADQQTQADQQSPKSNTNTDKLRKRDAVFVSRLGFADQKICYDLNEITETPHYLSLLLLGKKL